VAVTPGLEGAAELDVAEAFEPAEVFDERAPGQADGAEGDGADGEREARSVAGGDAVPPWEGRGRRRRCEVGRGFDAGLLPVGHEARQIGGVREEGEDGFEGIGEPLLGRKVVEHRVNWMRLQG
jgi:hypothetical protein